MPIDYDPFARRSVTVTQTGAIADPVEAARESIDVQALTQRLLDAALGRGAPLSMPELRAAEILLNKRMAAAPQQLNVAATVEVRDKRREIDAMVDALMRPGAVQRSPQGTPLLNLPHVPRDTPTARPDGKGPPDNVRVDD